LRNGRTGFTTPERQCFGCHIQTQASVGLNASTRKIPGLPISAPLQRELLDAYKTWILSSGYASPSFAGAHRVSQTSLWAWGASSYEGDELRTVTPELLRAMDLLITQEAEGGGWTPDHNAVLMWDDGAVSATHTAGNMEALAGLIRGLGGGTFVSFTDATLSGNEVSLERGKGVVDATFTPVSGVTGVRITFLDTVSAGREMFLNEIEAYEGTTLVPFSSVQTSAPNTTDRAIDGVIDLVHYGWYYNFGTGSPVPGILVPKLSRAARVDKIRLYQRLGDQQAERFTIEVTTDPNPSLSSSFTPVTITAVGETVETAGSPLSRFADSIRRGAQRLSDPTWDYRRNVRTAAQTIIGLSVAVRYLTGDALSAARRRMVEASEYLKSIRRPDGGWRDDRTDGASREYESAQALRALLLLSGGKLDEATLGATEYLLGTQWDDGSWKSAQLGNRLATTTWVQIALPSLYETLTEDVGRAAIQDLTAEGSRDAVTLSWSPIERAASYNVYRRSESDASTLLKSGVDTQVATYVDGEVIRGTTYAYTVRWVDSEGVEYPDSNEASATPFEVGCGGTPPVIRSVPLTGAAPGSPYSYRLVAYDPDPGEVLTYSLLSFPEGMTAEGSTGQITWTPREEQLGSYRVAAMVKDRAGRYATQSFTLRVVPLLENRAPSIVSAPVTTGVVGYPYAYQARATDPNTADILRYSVSGPSGMTISSSGFTRWSPSAAGTYPVAVTVTDLAGLSATQQFSLVVSENAAPRITSTAPLKALLKRTYYYAVEGEDPEGGALTYAVEGPTGMTIDAFTGVVLFSPTLSQVGSYPVKVTVQDSAGSSAVQSYTVTVPENQIPTITSDPVVLTRVNQPYVYDVKVVDLEGSGLSYALTEAPTGMTVSATGKITFSPTVVGAYPVTVRVSDADGGVATQSYTLEVKSQGVESVKMESPAPGSIVTAPVDLYATITVSEQTSFTWTAALRREGDEIATVPVGSGIGAANYRKIGTLDPTVLQNDLWYLDIVVSTTARDKTYSFPYEVRGNLKLGNFRMEVTDLTIPLTGVSIDITRMYDTLDRDAYEFGHGWRSKLPGRVVDSAPEGDAFVANDRVFVTRPDGRRVGFTFVPIPSGGISFLAMWKPYFKPDPGVTDSLEAFGASDYLLESGGQFFDFDVAFNPSTYVLTTRERIRYTIDEVKGLQEVRDPSGNTISFSETAITHSNGFSVAVTRDAAKRITKIVDGNGKAISYGYDASGNLTSVTET
jgi:YD repeat-containing protein